MIWCGDLNMFMFPCPKDNVLMWRAVFPCPQDNVMMWRAEWFPALSTVLWCERQCFPALSTMFWCEQQCFPALWTMLWCEQQCFPALSTMFWCEGQSVSLPYGQCYDVNDRVFPCPKHNVLMWRAECFPALRTMLWCEGQSVPISECTSVYLLHSHVIVNPLSLIAQHVHLKMEHYPCFRFVLLFKASICFRLFLSCFVFLHLSTFCASGTFFSLIFLLLF